MTLPMWALEQHASPSLLANRLGPLNHSLRSSRSQPLPSCFRMHHEVNHRVTRLFFQSISVLARGFAASDLSLAILNSRYSCICMSSRRTDKDCWYYLLIATSPAPDDTDHLKSTLLQLKIATYIHPSVFGCKLWASSFSLVSDAVCTHTMIIRFCICSPENTRMTTRLTVRPKK